MIDHLVEKVNQLFTYRSAIQPAFHLHMGKESETENPNAKNYSKSVKISEQAKLA